MLVVVHPCPYPYCLYMTMYGYVSPVAVMFNPLSVLGIVCICELYSKAINIRIHVCILASTVESLMHSILRHMDRFLYNRNFKTHIMEFIFWFMKCSKMYSSNQMERILVNVKHDDLNGSIHTRRNRELIWKWNKRDSTKQNGKIYPDFHAKNQIVVHGNCILFAVKEWSSEVFFQYLYYMHIIHSVCVGTLSRTYVINK